MDGRRRRDRNGAAAGAGHGGGRDQPHGRSAGPGGWRLLAMVAVVTACCGALTSGLAGPRPASAAGLSVGDAVAVKTDRLNLRASPGLAASVVEVLTSGTQGRVVDGPSAADGYDWYQIDVAGSDGWAAGDFLALTSTGDVFPLGAAVAVNTDALHVRSDPGLGGSVIDVLAQGATASIAGAPVSADGYTWYPIIYASGSGWVAGEFLAYAGGSGIQVGDTVEVNTDRLNLRAGPSLGDDVQTVLTSGDRGDVIGGPVYADGLTWFKLTLSGIGGTGWAAGEFLSQV